MANGFDSLQMICITMALIAIISFAAGRYWYYEGDSEKDKDFYEDIDTETRNVKWAEEIIKARCISTKGCYGCRSYMVNEGHCKYSYCQPWRWEDVG